MIPEVKQEYDEDYRFFYDAAMRKIGGVVDEDLFPQEVVNRVLRGEHPVKVFRQYRRLSVEQLAKKTGLSAHYIEDVEEGYRDAPRFALEKIAKALRVEIEEIA